MRFYIIILTILLSVVSVDAQQRIAKLRNANNFFEDEKYAQALELYELLMSTSAGRGVMGVDAKVNMAAAYRETDQVAKSKPVYQEVLKYADERPDILVGYGQALLASGQYSEARSYFLQYSDQRPDDPQGAELIKLLDAIESIVPIFDNVSVTYQEAVNDSLNDEFAPAYYGTGIVFVSDRVQKSDITANWGEKERSFLNLYFSDLTPEGQLASPTPFARRLNSNARHDGPATFSRDGNHCYYSQSAKAAPDSEEYTLQLFAAHVENGDWNSPQVLEFVTMGHMFSHPCLSADGRTLYFMSDMPGGFGGTDIWLSRLQNGKWSKPQNLGKDVNTDKNEAFPYMHPDGALYFASKGHANYGGYDLFRSRPTGNGVDWTAAQNLGEPFNTAFDDTYFLLSDDQTRGFFSSARDGSDNLYSFNLVGAEPQELPLGIVPRGGDASNFLETVDAGGGVSDEDLVDSLLSAGFKIEEPVDDPKEDTTNTTIDPDDPSYVENGDTSLVDPVYNPDDSSWVDNPDDPNWNPNSPDNPNVDPDNPDPNIANNDPNKWEDDPDNPDAPPLIDTDPEKANVKLLIDLKVLDKNSNAALTNAKVSVRNVFTDQSQDFKVDASGKISITLKPDQKYMIRAECSGYYGSTMPVTTMQAYEDQSVPAELPLIKK